MHRFHISDFGNFASKNREILIIHPSDTNVVDTTQEVACTKGELSATKTETLPPIQTQNAETNLLTIVSRLVCSFMRAWQ